MSVIESTVKIANFKQIKVDNHLIMICVTSNTPRFCWYETKGDGGVPIENKNPNLTRKIFEVSKAVIPRLNNFVIKTPTFVKVHNYDRFSKSLNKRIFYVIHNVRLFTYFEQRMFIRQQMQKQIDQSLQYVRDIRAVIPLEEAKVKIKELLRLRLCGYSVGIDVIHKLRCYCKPLKCIY